jgi:outer membrane protein TolC
MYNKPLRGLPRGNCNNFIEGAVYICMKNLAIGSLLLFFSFSLTSAEKITWEYVERQTMQNNPSIQSAKFRLENAQIAYQSSLSGYLPSVSLRGGASQGESEENFSRSYSYGLNASLSIFSGFETYNTVKQKSAELKAAEADYKRAVSDAAYEAAAQYVNLMWSYETVELLKQIKERRGENKDMIKLKYDSGNVDIGSLRRVEADAQTAAYDLRKAERYIETASAQLLKVIGRNDNIILETDERLDVENRNIERPDFNELVTSIPEFLAARYGADSYQALSSKSKSSLWPDISVSGSVSRFDREWTPDKQSWDAGISLSYSLFSGGKRYFDIKTAANQFKIAQENLKNISNQLKSKSVSNYNALLDSLESIGIRELYLEAAKLQAEISQRKYINGLATYQDWYSIENDYINSRRTLLDAKKAAILEKALWYNFIGEGFTQPGK